ncbi:hypothetical protein QPK77_08330 [Providencia rettgeri]|nr:hypothetical protein [Providencia rettgeri]
MIALPLVVGAILWATVAHEYELEWSTSAYSSFMKNGQLPFVILALSPILGAFVMYGHRSLQTFTQINATNKQIETATEQLAIAQRKNKVDLYFSKRKHIYEQFEYIKTRHGEKINKPTALYYSFFKKDKLYRNVINYDFFESFNALIVSINFNLDNVMVMEPKDFFNLLVTNKGKLDFYAKTGYSFSCLSDNVKLVKKNLGIEYLSDKSITSFYWNERDVYLEKKDIETSYISLINYIIDDLNDIINIIQEIVLIMLPTRDYKFLLNAITELQDKNNRFYKDITMPLMWKVIGDKVAAENQNPPE